EVETNTVAFRRTAVEALWWRQSVNRWMERRSASSGPPSPTKCACVMCTASAEWNARVRRIAEIKNGEAPYANPAHSHPLWRVIEGTFPPEVRVAVGLHEPLTGPTLATDLLLLGSAAVGGRIPEPWRFQ